MNWERLLLPYKQAADELKVKFDNISAQYGAMALVSPIFEVEARVKSVPSILAKARRKRIPMDEIEAQMQDISGIRIICRFLDDVKDVADIIMSRQDMTVVEDRDYVNAMKPSGYRGRHIIIHYPVISALGPKVVLCELQLRTMAMNMWAVTEHSLRYKYNGMIPAEIHKSLMSTAEAAYVLDIDTNKIRGEILEAEKTVMTREEMAAGITTAINDLYNVAGKGYVEEVYQKSVAVLNSNNLDVLAEFYNEIVLIAQAHKIR